MQKPEPRWLLETAPPQWVEQCGALEAVSLVDYELPDGKRKAVVCVSGEERRQGSEARRVLRVLGAKVEALEPPEGVERTVH